MHYSSLFSWAITNNIQNCICSKMYQVYLVIATAIVFDMWDRLEGERDRDVPTLGIWLTGVIPAKDKRLSIDFLGWKHTLDLRLKLTHSLISNFI